MKDYQQRKVDTVFGTVSFRSPRIVSSACEPPWYLETAFCPLLPIIPERATLELLALQAKLAAQMSYRQVVDTMREFLPVSEQLVAVFGGDRLPRGQRSRLENLDGGIRGETRRSESYRECCERAQPWRDAPEKTQVCTREFSCSSAED